MTHEQEILEELAITWFMRTREPMSAKECETFEQWLSVKEHKHAYDDVCQTWNALDDCASTYKPTPNTPTNNVFYTRRAFLYTSASFLLGLGAYGLYGHYLSTPVYARTFVSRQGETMEVTLPDGTHVSLDADTQLEVAYYTHQRETKVFQGQVMFSVTSDPQKAFHVKASDTLVTVVGTRFSVRNIDDIVKVAVQEGHVRVTNTTLTRTFDLLPSDGLVVKNTEMTPLKVTPDLVGAWQQGRVAFEDATLEETLREFARYGEKRLIATDEVKAFRVTGSFDITNSSNFVTALPSVIPIRYIKEGEKLLIVKR
ncbi:hypothetical protein SJPD1_1966 [Sulfurospirillum diekertiae]|uniref:FecR protein domain-containing protein n=1 Tax=Sulfurospirillum diekertiae TaxID=1854492 RepID=A0A290HFR2_9BACT|nr:FecR domain-containing protein [Sulfurospirillum diekertiae]ATB70071.1 hypothetical protein SJPD1_1966 [Sulfurospirillum diekertiae]